MAYNIRTKDFPSILATITDIDLTVTGQTSLITVPTGKVLLISDIVLRCSAVSGFVSTATARIGKAAAYTEWAPATVLTNISGVDNFIDLGVSAGGIMAHQTFSAGEIVKIDVTVASISTSHKVTAYVFGVLLTI